MASGMDENRKITGVRLPPRLLDTLDAWCKSQRPPVTRTAVIEMLVTDFVDEQVRKGWKPPKTK
jgi:metal-responsive CopG/Arc/MetJ family transcriptional regulator